MSIIAPDQLPTPTAVASVLVPPAPVWGVTSAADASPATTGRAVAKRRRTISAAAAGVVAVLAVGVTALGLQDGERTTARDTDRRSERGDREVGSGGSSGSGVPETTSPPSAGNASIDVAGSYQAMFGVAPSASTLECAEAGVGQAPAAVQAVVDGVATTASEIEIAMTPFAECAPADDFAGMMLTLGIQVVQPSTLDEMCALAVIDTFTDADRIGVLVDSYLDADQFVERLYSTFASCSF